MCVGVGALKNGGLKNNIITKKNGGLKNNIITKKMELKYLPWYVPKEIDKALMQANIASLILGELLLFSLTQYRKPRKSMGFKNKMQLPTPTELC